MTSMLNNTSSFAASVWRLGFGTEIAAGSRAPDKRLILYDFEACPFCRKAREALSHLGLEVEVRPAARGGNRRGELRKLGGKMMVPYLIDRNTGIAMYESDQIVWYLYNTYGSGVVPALHRLGPLNSTLSFFATIMRPWKGSRVISEHAQSSVGLLVLYNMESSPYCRKVREALTELDLAYICKNAPRGSRAREELLKEGSKMMVPFLIDPNHGVKMYESDQIVEYLYRTY
jgi:glutathione S-transferase